MFVVVDRVGLWDELSAMFGGSRDLTVFAPSNDAFSKLPASMRQQLLGRHDNRRCITSNKFLYLFPGLMTMFIRRWRSTHSRLVYSRAVQYSAETKHTDTECDRLAVGLAYRSRPIVEVPEMQGWKMASKKPTFFKGLKKLKTSKLRNLAF